MTSEPIRLLDDSTAASALRSDLQHAAAVEVKGLDFAAGLSAIQQATATSAAAGSSVGGMSALGKLGLGAAVVVATVWLGLRDREPSPAGEPVPVASATAEEVHGQRPPPMPEASQPKPAVIEAPVVAEPAEAAQAVELGPVAGSGSTPIAEPDPTRAEEIRRKPRSAKKTPVEVKVDDFDDRLLREARLVARARAALDHDPKRALSLTRRAEDEFPDGQLVEERRALAIRALVALGRTDEARRRADAFLARYSRGAHAAAVRRALAN